MLTDAQAINVHDCLIDLSTILMGIYHNVENNQTDIALKQIQSAADIVGELHELLCKQ